MIKQVTIARRDHGGRYSELLDVSEYLAERVYGSAVNAIKQLAVGNPEYAKALHELRARGKRQRK